jgi:hypothetical protein
VKKSPKDQLDSPIVSAALAVDAELRRFHDVCRLLQKSELNSQKALQRAGETLKQIVESEQRLGETVRNLVQAITHAREEQEAEAIGVQTRAKEIEARSLTYQELLERYAALGQEASDLNTRITGLAAPESGKDPVAELEAADGSILALMQGAQDLAAAAREKDFNDISRQAESLRQQLAITRGKLLQVRGRIQRMN